MKYYINNFIIYSILGFILETTLKYVFFPKLHNGSLYGPWIPVYGFGVCLIIAIMRTIFNRIKTNRIIKVILLFITSTILLTILELLGGHLIEFITGKIFWDYSKMKFNIGHYICLEISLIWGITSLLIVYIIKPQTDKLIKKIPSIITYSVLFLFLIDLIFSLINLD